MARSPKQVCSWIGFAFLAMSVAWHLALWPAEFLLGQAGVPLGNPYVVLLLHLLPVYLVGLPVFLWVMRRIPESGLPRPAQTKPGAGYWLLCFAVLLFVSFLSNLVSVPINFMLQNAFGAPRQTMDTVVSFTGAPLAGFLASVAAGVGEEYICRVALWRKMAGCSDMAYCLVSGVCFGVLHGNLIQAPGAAVYGFALAWIYLQTRSYLLVASLHFTNDFLAMVLLPMAQSVFPPIIPILSMVMVLVPITVSILLLVRHHKALAESFCGAAEAGWAPSTPGASAAAPQNSRQTSLAVCFLVPGMLLYFLWSAGLFIYNFWAA